MGLMYNIQKKWLIFSKKNLQVQKPIPYHKTLKTEEKNGKVTYAKNLHTQHSKGVLSDGIKMSCSKAGQEGGGLVVLHCLKPKRLTPCFVYQYTEQLLARMCTSF